MEERDKSDSVPSLVDDGCPSLKGESEGIQSEWEAEAPYPESLVSCFLAASLASCITSISLTSPSPPSRLRHEIPVVVVVVAMSRVA